MFKRRGRLKSRFQNNQHADRLDLNTPQRAVRSKSVGAIRKPKIPKSEGDIKKEQKLDDLELASIKRKMRKFFQDHEFEQRKIKETMDQERQTHFDENHMKAFMLGRGMNRNEEQCAFKDYMIKGINKSTDELVQNDLLKIKHDAYANNINFALTNSNSNITNITYKVNTPDTSITTSSLQQEAPIEIQLQSPRATDGSKSSSYSEFDKTQIVRMQTFQKMKEALEVQHVGDVVHLQGKIKAKKNVSKKDHQIVIQDNQFWIHSSDRKQCLINPDSHGRVAWDLIFVFTGLLYTSIRVPFAIAFQVDSYHEINTWFYFNRLVDIIFIADMFLIFITAIKNNKNELVTNYKSIAHNYFKTWFIIDFVASFPLDLVLHLIEINSATTTNDDAVSAARSSKLLRAMRLFKTLRILKLAKLQKLINDVQFALNVNFNVTRIVKYAIVIFLIAHILACGFIAVANDTPENIDSWISCVDHAEERWQVQYTAAVYWALTSMSTIGYGDIAAVNTTERFYSIFAAILGALTFAYCISQILHTVAGIGKTHKNLINDLSNVDAYAAFHHLPPKLVTETKKYFHYKNNRNYFNQSIIMNNLPQSLKRQVVKHMYADFLTQLPIFKGIESEFLNEVMLNLKTEFFVPYSVVVSRGQIGSSMYIIRNGKCGVYKDEHSAVILGIGQSFGEISLLQLADPNKYELASVVTIDWCDLMVITRHSLLKILPYYPSAARQIERFAKKKIRHWKSIYSENTLSPKKIANISKTGKKSVSPSVSSSSSSSSSMDLREIRAKSKSKSKSKSKDHIELRYKEE